MLATIKDAQQTSDANTPLLFDSNPVKYGTSISHAIGSSNVVISSPGIYLVSFHATTSIPGCTDLPANGHLHLTANGTNVAGGTVMHTFAGAEAANLAFTIPVVVKSVPTTLSVVAQERGIIYSNAALTVLKIGVEPTP